MITDQDINKLKNVFATKEDLEAMKNEFATKEEFNELKTEFHDFKDHVVKHMATKTEMLEGFEKVLGAIQDLRDENAAGYATQKRHENWIKGIASHVDYDLNES